MAVLFKEEIDKTYRNDVDAEQSARMRLNEKAKQLRDKLTELSDKCKDLCDTFEYVEKRGYDVSSFVRPYVTEKTDCIKFQHIMRDRIAINYHLWTDYQSLYFQDDEFIVQACHSFNGKETQDYLKNVDFDSQDEYFVEQCVRLMTRFLQSFNDFSSKFISYIEKKFK